MALWTGLGQAATVAQLVGADVGGLISMIVQAAMTAQQNKSECEQLARRVLMIAQLLPHVQEPEAAQPLDGLGDTLRDAHELVVSCQGRSVAYQFVMAGRTAERFREVQSKIDSYLILFPVISHIGITRRLERIYNVLVPDESARGEPPHPLPHSTQLQEFTDIAQDKLPYRTQEFTLAEIVAATNNFALDNEIGEGLSGTVYKGRLHDGREVAIKRFNRPHSHTPHLPSHHLEEQFHAELDSLSRIRHKHIVGLLGSCVTVSKDNRLLTTPQNRKKRLLTWWRKELEEPEGPEEQEEHTRRKSRKGPERLIVYEYMENGILDDHLRRDVGSSPLSPVTVSWKMRIDVLIAVSRAIEHLHCHANPPIIHGDVKSANILFDANWVPRLSDFGSSVALHMESEESELKTDVILGTVGYVDPEYFLTRILKPTSDLYNLGVLMLEVLTGKRAIFPGEEPATSADLVSFALPVIEAGNFEELLDRRRVPEPTPGQLKALEHVAQTARCCLKLNGKDRPVISDIVANLEKGHELICRDEPGSVDESTPHASSVPSTGSQIPTGAPITRSATC